MDCSYFRVNLHAKIAMPCPIHNGTLMVFPDQIWIIYNYIIIIMIALIIFNWDKINISELSEYYTLK